jgi:hypothetical protein
MSSSNTRQQINAVIECLYAININKFCQLLFFLEFPEFFIRRQSMLKIINTILFNPSQCRLLRMEQVVDSVRNSVVEIGIGNLQVINLWLVVNQKVGLARVKDIQI